MAQLDQFLSAMATYQAESFILESNSEPCFVVAGSRRVVNRQRLTDAQVISLVRQLFENNPDILRNLDQRQTFTARYVLGENEPFEVRFEALPERLKVTILTAQEAPPAMQESNSPPPPPIAPPPPPPPTHDVPMPSVSVASAPIQVDQDALAKINKLFQILVERRGSDLHISPGEFPVVRVDGEIIRMDDMGMIDPGLAQAMILSIIPADDRDRFLHEWDLDFAYEISGLARFRGNAFRDHKGFGGVFRVIPLQIMTLEDLRLPTEVQNLCFLNKGLVLVTGPTGVGKTTTLTALLDFINRKRSSHIITIEDPIEFIYDNKRCLVNQREVGRHTRSFEAALRAAMREDPDIIMVGELRDLETVEITLTLAETGHLVFGSLHTSTAAGTVDRMIEQFPKDRQAQVRISLADSLRGVVAQTLVRKIGGGRTAAMEILFCTPSVANLMREGKTHQIHNAIQTGKKWGMQTLNDALIKLVNERLVAPKEAYLKSIDRADFERMLKENGHDTSFVAATF